MHMYQLSTTSLVMLLRVDQVFHSQASLKNTILGVHQSRVSSLDLVHKPPLGSNSHPLAAVALTFLVDAPEEKPIDNGGTTTLDPIPDLSLSDIIQGGAFQFAKVLQRMGPLCGLFNHFSLYSIGTLLFLATRDVGQFDCVPSRFREHQHNKRAVCPIPKDFRSGQGKRRNVSCPHAIVVKIKYLVLRTIVRIHDLFWCSTFRFTL